jgi:8-oxo-dGTP pyrophosphatase MutT (NUDIX family)
MPNITLSYIRSFFSFFCREEIVDNTLVHAGVLVPLFLKNDELHVIFTQRTDEVEHHKGQVSFPGGVMDKEDQTIIDTALREAEEEIGLKRDLVEVLGISNDFRTPSGFRITPVIGFLAAIQSFVPNKNEVSEIFDVPLSFFLDPCNERVEQHMRSGKIMNIYFYSYGKYEIWGATAAMLRSFLINLAKQNGRNKIL